MVYIKLSENLVSYSKECSEFDNVLYTLDWDLARLIHISRPWKVLGRKDDVYKPSIIQDFLEVWKFDEQPDEYYNKFSSDLLNDLLGRAKELEEYQIITPVLPELPKYDLVYNCDILNLLEDYYGSEGLQKLQDFIDLTPDELELLRKFYKETTKERKITLIQSSMPIVSLDRISGYLPSWCKDSIKVFGTSREGVTKKVPVFSLPEYKNSLPLGYTDKVEIRREMIDEIYSEFELGSVLRGSEIRTRFREIYQKYGLNPKASLFDFMEYFVIRKAKSEYEWYYRIVRRKKDEVMKGLDSESSSV